MATTRRRERPERHPTAQRLLDVVVAMLAERAVDQITVDQVLETSGVSRSSLYHHFEDFPDLVEHGIAARVAALNVAAAQVLDRLLSESIDGSSFRARVFELNQALHAKDREEFRMLRVVSFALADRNPRFRATLARHQQEVTDSYERVLRTAAERGWLRPGVDPAAAAVLVQALTLGRVVDDISEHPIDPDAWTGLTATILTDVLLMPAAD